MVENEIQVEKTAPFQSPFLTAQGLFGGSDDTESGEDPTTEGPSQSQQNEARVDVDNVVNHPTGESQGNGTRNPADEIDIKYHPLNPSQRIDHRASSNQEFPLYGIDGQADISISWDPRVERHWIEVITADQYEVRLRNGDMVEIDNDNSPTRFRPEIGAADCGVTLILSTDEDNFGHYVAIRPESGCSVQPTNEHYLSVETVQRE